MQRFTVDELRTRLQPILNQTFRLPVTRNKGEVGLWLEEKTGIPHSSACLDCVDGELKTFPLKRLANGRLVPKETVAVTMLNTEALKTECFADSRCCKKLNRVLLVPYLREAESITVMTPKVICAEDPTCAPIYETFRADYSAIQENFKTTGELKSAMGTYLQNRTKGAGRGAPKTRAFYLRTDFLREHCLA